MKTPEQLDRNEYLPHSQCLRFLEQGNHTPAGAYIEYCRRREIDELPPASLYLSTPIMPAGHAQYEDANKPEAIQWSKNAAKDLAEHGLIEQGLPRDGILLPSELDYVPDWTRLDALCFSLYLTRALHPEQAFELENRWLNSGNSEYALLAEEMVSAQTDERRKAAYDDFLEWFRMCRDNPEGSELLEPFWSPPLIMSVLDNNYSRYTRPEYSFGEYILDMQPGLSHDIHQDHANTRQDINV